MQKIGPALQKRSEQQHRILNVDHSVGTRILRRKHTASFLGGESFWRDRKQQWPLPFRTNGSDLRFGRSRHARNGEPTHPAGGGIVRMMLAARSLADNLRVRPA